VFTLQDNLIRRHRTDSEELRDLEDEILIEAEGGGSGSFAEDEDSFIPRVGGGRKFDSGRTSAGGDTVTGQSEGVVSAGAVDDDLMMEDIDDMDLDFDDTPAPAVTMARGTPIDESTCKSLRHIVFGRTTGQGFPNVWLEQGFVFNSAAERYDTPYIVVVRVIRAVR